MEHVGQTVTLAGFLENVREVGQNFAFAVLRDFYGVTQVVVENEAMWKAFKGLNKESTVQITGVVRERDSKNPKLPTGDIEVVPEAVEVLGRCRHNELPFQITRPSPFVLWSVRAPPRAPRSTAPASTSPCPCKKAARSACSPPGCCST